MVTFAYDGSGRLQSVTDREGRVESYTYDGTSHRLATVTNGNSKTLVSNTYDAQGRVSAQRDGKGLLPGEQQTTFAYAASGAVAAYPTTAFEPTFTPSVEDTYTAQGWIASRVAKPSSTETNTEAYTYDTAKGTPATVTDPRGNVTAFCFDVAYDGTGVAGSRGDLTRVIQPPPTAGASRPTALFSYDAKDNLVQFYPPNGVTSGAGATCTTNLAGALAATFAVDRVYDPTGAELREITRRYTEPGAGVLTATTTLEYGDATNPGRITKIIPPRGNASGANPGDHDTLLTYVGSGCQEGMLQSRADPLGNTVTYAYDCIGRRTAYVDANGNVPNAAPVDHTWNYEYDDEDGLRFLRTPAVTVNGNPTPTRLVTEFRYDGAGNRTFMSDPNGYVTRYEYDERELLHAVLQSPTAADPGTLADGDPKKYRTTYTYDPLGNLARLTRAVGMAGVESAVDYAYDGLDRVRSERQCPAWPTTTPTLVTAHNYDANGNRTRLVQPNDGTSGFTDFGYDALNRLVGMNYSSPNTADVTYAYDANGNRLGMASGGATAYAYDELNRLTSIDGPGGADTVGYRYDRDGKRTKVIYPNTQVVEYLYDTAARLTGLKDWANRQTTYTYFPDGRPRGTTAINGTTATYAYDNARRVTALHHTGPPRSTGRRQRMRTTTPGGSRHSTIGRRRAGRSRGTASSWTGPGTG